MASHIELAVEEIVTKLLAGSDVELVDVSYVKEREQYLRVFIDRPDGIGIDDCQDLSEKLEKVLDERDIVPASYILEVSSPGLDRALKKPRDFERERGKTVEVSFYEPKNGEKIITGRLISHDGKVLTLEGIEPIPSEKIANVRLHLEF